MKKLLLSVCALMALNAGAQYSQWTYGLATSGSSETALSGMVLQTTDPGHIMAGTQVLSGASNVYVVKNDLDGNSNSAPYFNKAIRLRDADGIPLYVTSAKVIELQHSVGYAIGGVAKNVNNKYILFYMLLNSTGTIVNGPVGYQPSSSTMLMEFGSIKEDASGSAVYLVGGIDLFDYQQTGEFFVHKIDHNGGIKWSNIYAVYNGSPFSWLRAYGATEDVQGNELAVAGTLDIGTKDGFLTKIDPASGNPIINYVQLYGETNTQDEILSITYSHSDPQGNPRYLLAGMSDYEGDLDTWIMLMDQTVYPLWSVLTDDGGSNMDNGAGHIIERENASGDLEYYTMGATLGGLFGGIDAHLVKGDVSTGIPSLHYVYGGSSNDIGYCLDYNNTGTGTGLAIFGSTKSFTSISSPQEMYFIKAYFNGEVGCNAGAVDFGYTQELDFREILDMNIVDNFSEVEVFASEVVGDQYELCYDVSLSDGSNDFVTLPDESFDNGRSVGETGVKLSPNPVAPGAGNVQVEIEAAAGTVLTITITDLLGRNYTTTVITTSQNGAQYLSLELGNIRLAPGMYIVKIYGLHKPASAVLLIK